MRRLRMIIKELYLKNYRCFDEVKIVFPKDCRTIGFIGRNGAGKSSILDAIFIAFYGLGSKGSGKKLEEVVRNGRGQTKISLTFEYGGEIYRIDRTFERILAGRSEVKKSSCFLYRVEDGKRRRICDNSDKVLKWVSERLGPPDIFRTAIYVQQNEITRILENPKELARFFMSYLGLEKWSNALGNMNLLIGYIGEKKREVEGSLKELQEDIRKLTLKIEQRGKEIRELQQELEKLKDHVERLREEREKLETAKEYLEAKSKLEDALERKKRTKENMQKYMGWIVELEDKLKKLRALEEERIEERLAEIENLLNQIKGLRDEIEGEKRSLARLREEVDRKENRVKALEERRKAIRGSLSSQLSSLNDDELERELTDLLNKIERSEKTLEQIKRKWGEEVLREITRNLGKEGEIKEEINKLDERKGELERKIAISLEKIKTLRESVTKLQTGKGKCPLCQAELSEERKRKLIEEYSNQIKALNELLFSLKNEKKELEGKLKELKRLHEILLNVSDVIREGREAEKLIQEIGGIERTYEILEWLKELRNFERELEDLRISENQLKKAEERIKNISEELQKLLSRGDERELEEKRRSLISKMQMLKLLRNERIEERIEGFKREVEEAKKELDELSREINELRDQVERLRESLIDLGVSPEELRSKEVERMLKKIEEELEKEKEEFSKKMGKLEELRHGLEDFQKELEEKRKRFEKRRKIKEGLGKLEAYVSKIKEKISEILEKAINTAILEVQDTTNQIFQEFTEKNYIVELIPKIHSSSGERRIDEISVKVRYGDLEDVLSGGERVALALALRSAIAQILSLTRGGSEPILILDEPTINLDQQNREKLSELLERHLGQLKQVIVVSHNPEILRSIRKIYRVIYDEERGVSKVVVEEE